MNEIEVSSNASVLAVMRRVEDLYKNVMVKNVDYGTIPGCGPKPVLLKSGAEKLNLAFNLYADVVHEEITELNDFHRDYKIKIALISRKTGETIGTGIGEASTLEKKFKRENPPDIYNTVYKMAKKRALVDADLTALGASVMFTQDLIEKEEESQ